MTSFDDDDDGDDDFDDSDDAEGSVESHVWQLLQIINPGDHESALQQFSVFREAYAEHGEAHELLPLIMQAIDWQAGFQVETGDTHALVQAIDELVARWNLTIDWNGDPDDSDFHADTDIAELFASAYDSLNPYGYTLWAWEGEPGYYGGWISLSRDSEWMRQLATALDINLRLGSEVS